MQSISEMCGLDLIQALVAEDHSVAGEYHSIYILSPQGWPATMRAMELLAADGRMRLEGGPCERVHGTWIGRCPWTPDEEVVDD